MSAREDNIEKAKEAMQSLIDSMNCMVSDKEIREAMYEVLVNTHRTLQQSFWRNTFNVMERYGELQYFDLRNEASVEVCKKLADQMKEDYDSLPFV